MALVLGALDESGSVGGVVVSVLSLWPREVYPVVAAGSSSPVLRMASSKTSRVSNVVEEDGRLEKSVGPPSRNAFDGVVYGNEYVWDKCLCARGKEELVVSAANDASDVGINLYVYDL